MQSFIARNQFIRETQAWHQSTFLQPENGTERTRKENSFNGCKSDEPFLKTSLVDPTEGPVSFFLYTFHRLNGMEKFVFLFRIFYVGIDQKRIGFGMNIFDGDLKTVEEFCFCVLNF